MSIDRRFWKGTLTESYAPRWPCPSCTMGVLRLKRETLHYRETAESRRSHYDEHLDITDVAFAFSALLECNRCSGKISCCGVGGYELVDDINGEGKVHFDHQLYFVPKYFSTPMEIFRPSARCPNTVKEQLRNSFAVFFCDLGAAANHVRQCLEEILSDAGIQSRNSRGKFVSLKTRIKSFGDRDQENADRAHALRWIGNFGSHPQALTKDDLFDAYEILEVLLEDIYVGHQRSVQQMVEQINKTRGPRR